MTASLLTSVGNDREIVKVRIGVVISRNKNGGFFVWQDECSDLGPGSIRVFLTADVPFGFMEIPAEVEQ